MYVYMYIYIFTLLNIYICKYNHILMSLCMRVYLYMYIDSYMEYGTSRKPKSLT